MYFLCDKHEKKRLLNECLLDLTLPRPKDDDLEWTVRDINTGKWIKSKQPIYITDVNRSKDRTSFSEEEQQMTIFDYMR